MPERDAAPSALLAFAGGGSGGHLSPGLAVAERLIVLSPQVRPLFLCSMRAIDETMLREAGADFVQVPAEPPSMRPLKLLRFASAWRTSQVVASRELQRHRVREVVSLGGFVAAPVVRRARRLGLGVTILNLDAMPGKANRWIARRADRVWSAVPTKGLPRWDGQVLGFPVRRAAMAPGDAAACRAELGLDPARRTLLVTGASQGAASLNTFVPHFATRQADAMHGWQVLHLAGSMDEGAMQAIRDRYRNAGVPAVVMTFLHRMGLAWGAADLAVSRAGANSVAEARANRVPCLFVPYPFHKDLHQRENARELVEAGAAAIALDAIDAQANMIGMGRLLESLLTDGPSRDRMHAALERMPGGDAAEQIAQRLLQVLEGGT
jgi:UDP-N-acetylglucosamine--N-acetylmuramyl-(pentapeptide) pyrophosphoryl-undecaprenol N-acetylglucosamine transferase